MRPNTKIHRVTQASIGADQEERRRVLEARAWLRDGYTTAAKVDALMVGIRKHRGERAAEQLREDMRQQWRRRHEWMQDTAVTSPR